MEGIETDTSQAASPATLTSERPDSSRTRAMSFVKPTVQPPAPLNTSAVDSAEEWKLWKQMWENYGVLTDLASQPEPYQTALLLHCLGPEGVRIYNGLKFNTEDEGKICTLILQKLDLHFLGVTREFFERFKFNQRSQEAGESIEQYITLLRTMSKSCGFCACMKEKLLMDRLLLGVVDDRMREQMMAVPDLTLSKAIDICKAIEATTTQMKALKQDEVVHQISRKSSPAHATFPRKQQKPRTKDKVKVMPQTGRCKFCCTTHALRKELCPAWGRVCDGCGRKNHFKSSKMCIVHAIEDASDDSSAESISTVTEIHSVRDTDGPVYCQMVLNEQSVKFQIDCGATVNLLPDKFLKPTDKIRPEKPRLQMWNKSRQSSLGRCKVKTTNPVTGVKYKVDYVIVAEDYSPLLSKKAAEQMKLITIHYDAFEQIHAVQNTPISDYPSVFAPSSLGILPGPGVHLTVSPDAQPVIRPARTVPESLKGAVKDKLEALCGQGVIEAVDGPTDWVNQMAVVKKKTGGVRICIDPRPLNNALKREHYTLPVLDDILPSLTKASSFSICDLKDGYLHCPLDYESSLLTTFATPWGRYRWTRLPFGLKVSSEIFQKRLHQALDGLAGVRCIADDIIIWGESPAEHNHRLHSLLERCQEIGIVLNPEKSKFHVKEVQFLGHIVTSSGLKVDPSKVDAILKMRAPSNTDDVHRLRGMVNYLSRYLPRLSEVIQPLNDLTRKGVAWTWDANHEKAFREIKALLAEAPVLAYFDQTKRIEIFTDASATGIGAALVQDGKPVAYASRALTDTEARYAVIEKEMLAIVFALEKWHQFTYGQEVTILSDHKPLETIVKKALEKAPRRLQSLLLRAMAYNITVQYVKGKDNLLADPLSRSYLPCDKDEIQSRDDVEAINSVHDLTLPDRDIACIRNATATDDAMLKLMTTILEGWPQHKSQVSPLISSYFHYRDELATQDGLIFRGQRLIIPTALRGKMKADVHVGHVGVDGCLRRAREHIFWPGMSRELKEFVQACAICQEHATSQPAQPLISHEVPNRPWAKVGIDLFHFKDKVYLITTCYFSSFFEIDQLHKTTAQPVITKLKQQFARYGIPTTIISDNGPPFSSQEFTAFCRDWQISLKTISPHHSRSNGKVESAVKIAKRLLRKCQSSDEDINMALLNIRNTPTQAMDSSPSQRFLGRRTRTLLPTTASSLEPERSTAKDAGDIARKQRSQKTYFDRHARALPKLKEGDVVRAKPFTGSDRTWKKATVLRRLGDRSYEISCHGHVYRRNREHLRAVRAPPASSLMLPTYLSNGRQSKDDSTSVGPSRPTTQPQAHPADVPLTEGAGPHGTQSTAPDESLRRSLRSVREPVKMKDYLRY